MPRTNAKVYSIMDRSTLNTLTKAEIAAWVVETRLKHDPEFLITVLKCLPYDHRYGLTVAAIVADLKANWRVGFKNPAFKKWDCYEEGVVIAKAIAENKNVKKKLGSGAFGSAFLMKDDRVLKINTGRDSYDSWFSWAIECQKNGGRNPLMPHIYEISHFGTTYAAFMEKLEGWTSKKMSLGAFGYMEGYFLESPIYVHSKLNSENVLGPGCGFDHVNEVSEILKGIVQSVFKARMDLHSDNAMFRGDQLVITDPLAYGSVPQWLEPFEEVRKKVRIPDVTLDKPKTTVKVGMKKGELFFNPFDWGAMADPAKKIRFHTFHDWGLVKHLRIDPRADDRKLPGLKVKDNGKRFGLSFNGTKHAKNFRLSAPKPWFRMQEDAHNEMYNELLKGMKFDDFFAKGEPQGGKQMKILKGRKDVNAEGAQAP